MQKKTILIVIAVLLIIGVAGVSIYIWSLPARVLRQVQEIQPLVKEMYVLQVKVETSEDIPFLDQHITIAHRKIVSFVHVIGHVFVDLSAMDKTAIHLEKGKIIVKIPPLQLDAKPEPDLSTVYSDIELEWWVQMLVDAATGKVTDVLIQQLGSEIIRELIEKYGTEAVDEKQLSETLGRISEIASGLLSKQPTQSLEQILVNDPITYAKIVEESQQKVLELMCRDDYINFYLDRYEDLLEIYLNKHNLLPVDVVMSGVNCP